MSTVKSKKLQVGTDATASNNFTIYQPSTPDGTLRIGVGNADNPTEVGQFNANGYKPQQPVAFYAYRTTNQSISANTNTKVAWTSERFDTNSNFDNATNYRFTPTVAGYYQLNAHVSWNGLSTTQGNIYIYQNGSDIAKTYTVGSGFGYYNSVNIVAYANGSTDYFEIYVRNSSTDNVTAGTQSHFSGILISQA